MRNSEHGRAGEERAARYLQSQGYRIVQRNVRLPGGEIDLICEDGETVFIEVKSRSNRAFGGALRGVNSRKRRTLRRLAEDYLQFIPQRQARFDVVAIDGESVVLHRNAF